MYRHTRTHTLHTSYFSQRKPLDLHSCVPAALAVKCRSLKQMGAVLLSEAVARQDGGSHIYPHKHKHTYIRTGVMRIGSDLI